MLHSLMRNVDPGVEVYCQSNCHVVHGSISVIPSLMILSCAYLN